jgi:hypothetical protein
MKYIQLKCLLWAEIRRLPMLLISFFLRDKRMVALGVFLFCERGDNPSSPKNKLKEL